MPNDDKVNILKLVDDQAAKLLAYEVMLLDLGENLVKANSARQALELLLKTDVAVVLMDVSMPELDGFELAAMVRNAPSPLPADRDHLRLRRPPFRGRLPARLPDGGGRLRLGAGHPGGASGKIRCVFCDLYCKTRELESLNAGLEARVKERTSALEETAARLRASEQRRLQLGRWRPARWAPGIGTWRPGDVQWG